MRLFQAAVLAVPLVIAAGAGWAHRFVTDDGFIYFRTIKQITAGNGPVFNVGERVESFTSPLWVALLTVADVLSPIRLEWLAIGIGLLGSVAGLGLAMAGARALVRLDAPDAFLVPFGALVYVALLPVWLFQTSGLETGLVFFWEGLCLYILANWARSGMRISAPRAIVLGLGWLVRPELVLFSALFVLLVLVVQWTTDSWRDRLRFLVSASALPVAYEIFRMGYYGAIVSNTGIAKEGTDFHWHNGTVYLSDLARPYWLWIPAVVLVLGGYVPLVAALVHTRRRRAVAVVATFVAVGLVDGLYVIAVGGDYLHGRLFLPGIFALCAPVAVVPWVRRYAVALVVAPWIIASAFFLRPPQVRGHQLAHGVLLPTAYGAVTAADRGWVGGSRPPWFVGDGYYLQTPRLTSTSYKRVDIPLARGVPDRIGEFSSLGVPSSALPRDFFLLDAFGLADPLAARLEVPREHNGSPLAGHNKQLPPAWAAARVQASGSPADPQDFIPSSLLTPTRGAAFEEQVAWARAALRCPDIRYMLQGTTAPMTPRRFVSNILHSVDRTQMRIPPDPREAYEKFCGPGIPREVEAVRAAQGSG